MVAAHQITFVVGPDAMTKVRRVAEASGSGLRNGDRVRIGLTSFSVLPVKSSGAWSPRLVPLSVTQEFPGGSNSSWN